MVRVKTKELTYMNSAICHVCDVEMSYDLGVRPRRWAYGMAGVRWVVCSYECARQFDGGAEPDGREDEDAGVAV